MATTNLLPNNEGDVQTWTPYPASIPPIHYDKVDDPVGSPDLDSTYVHQSALNRIEEFNIQDPTSIPDGATIDNVRVIAGLKKIDAGDTVKVNIGVKIAPTRYPGSADKTLSTAYANYLEDFALNPADGQPWEKTDLINLQISLEMTAGTTEARCTQTYVVITYTPLTPATGRRPPRPGAAIGLSPIL